VHLRVRRRHRQVGLAEEERHRLVQGLLVFGSERVARTEEAW
jgi:hypothetical protein